MGRRIDARDVLDANAVTAVAFRGKIVGLFRRRGPNAWDPYEYVSHDGDEFDVNPKLRVQAERQGARFRMRRQGEVVRVEWVDVDGVGGNKPAERRAYFLAELVQPFDHAQGQAAAVIASKLRR